MRAISLSIVTLLMFFGTLKTTEAKDWRGIVPLHSTREDVERLLGAPRADSSCKCSYSSKTENVFVTYSSGEKCGSATHVIWKVPKDIVISLTVYPLKTPAFRSLKLNLNDFRKLDSGDAIGGPVSYRNERIGLEIAIYKGMVESFDYIPSTLDVSLGCLGAKPDGAINPSILTIEEKELLDKFMTQLDADATLRGLIEVDEEVRLPNQPSLAVDVKKYLNDKYKKNMGRVTIAESFRLRERLGFFIEREGRLIRFPED